MALPGARRTLVATLVLIAVAATAAAQIWVGGYGRTPARFPTETTFTGGFNFCRVMFTSSHREKQGWGTDYPGADINFSIRLSELTKIQVKMTDAGEERSRCRGRATDRRCVVQMPVHLHGGRRHRVSAAEVAGLQDYR